MSDSKSTEGITPQEFDVFLEANEIGRGTAGYDYIRKYIDQELAKAKLQEWITAPLQPHAYHANHTRMCTPTNYRNARIRELRGQTLNNQTKDKCINDRLKELEEEGDE